ncbi:MAG: phytoene/squalene synthase family protein [Myxococcota bacterium]
MVPDVDQLDTEASDLATCESLLRFGSRSFYLASRLLPPKVRKAAIATYAFCRQADDAIDEGQDLDSIRKRIADVYGEAHSELPTDQAPAHPADRALRKVVREHAIPKEVFDLMLQGFHWDLEGRPYESLDDLLEYCVRVASTVGVLMSTVMGRRDTEALFRACDLGVAMQLTNIARDVGEDAQSGRLYLPRDWLRSEGIDADRWLENPAFKPEIARVVARLLREADRYFASAEPGIHLLPWESRVAIQAASVAYADIGNQIRKKGFDSVNHRAYTSSRRKLWLLLKSGSKVVMPKKADSEPRLKQAEALVQTMAA